MNQGARRGRFAPTPSGQMHIGNARTALLAWLQMRKAGGTFVMRIEDIDRLRSRPEYAKQILDDLRWLGIDWDEGPDIGGPYEPYEQSRREVLYEEAVRRLNQDDRLYRCYCSRADLLSAASAPHGLASEGPPYPGTCRRLTTEEQLEREAHKVPSLRFALPDRTIRFEDGLQGEHRYPVGAGGDFVVKRADGIIGYQLAVVVDDAAMRITDVLRGADLLDSTPRQLLLFEALGFPPPRYAHVSLVYGADGTRLSKRNKSLMISAMRAAGTSAERVVGTLAYLSGLIQRPEPVQAHELIAGFDLSRIPRSPAVLTEELLQVLL